MPSPLVTIYIPCRNYGAFLRQAIDSVLSQHYSNWEVFIFDEGSSDDTRAIAEHFAAKHPDQIKFIHNPEPVGLQRIANRALSLARGKYLMRLDADDWLDEFALVVLVTKIESLKDTGMVYGNYYLTAPNGAVLGVERNFEVREQDSVSHFSPPHGACSLISTRLLKSIQGYSEDVNAQDGWELWHKLLGRAKAVNVDIPIFYYRQHPQSLSKDRKRLFRARTQIFEKLQKAVPGDYQPNICAIIPVKMDYPDLDNVPFYEIDGQTLLERSINQASRLSMISDVIVTTDSAVVYDACQALEDKSKVPQHFRIMREAQNIHGPGFPLQNILQEALEHYQQETGLVADILVYLNLHSLFREDHHISTAVNTLTVTNSDSVVSVVEEVEPLFVNSADGLSLFNKGRFRDLAFEREKIYKFNGALIALWADQLQMDSGMLGQKINYLEMSASESQKLTRELVKNSHRLMPPQQGQP